MNIPSQVNFQSLKQVKSSSNVSLLSQCQGEKQFPSWWFPESSCLTLKEFIKTKVLCGENFYRFTSSSLTSVNESYYLLLRNESSKRIL